MNVGDRKQRSPVGTEVIRRRTLRCQSSRKARVALGASLALMFGATATLGGEVEDVAFVGTPTGGYYNAGEAIGLEVAFTEPVTVTGAPTFTLTVGRLQRNMVYDAQASSADTLRFNYTVVDGDMDDDGVSYGANALRGGRIESGSPPSAVDRTHPARARDSNRRVDARKPRVAAVRLTSNPGPDRVYGIGDTVEVTATFDELVTTGDAVLALTVGRESRDMALAGTGRRRALIFRYTVIEGDEDANGVSVAADALSGTIQDAAGNEATLALRRVPDQSGHAVDGIPPSDPSLRIVSNPRGGGIYRRGESILVELRFGETVQVSGDANPTLTLRVGTGDDDVTRSATYDPDRSGGRALVFRYAVVEADSDQDGISVAADAVTPANVIRDSAGSLWDGTHSALAEQRSHRVDGSLPTVRVKDVDITSVGPYGVDDSIALEVRFTGPVHGADNNMKFRLRVGDETEEMDYDDGNGSETLTFEYEVQQGDLDDDGVGYAANALVGSGRLIDGHGWPVDRAVAARARLSDQVVDGVHPRLLDEPLNELSRPRDGDAYAAGESIEIAVMFDEPVRVRHGPDLRLGLRIGTNDRRGVLVGGDDPDTLIFRYTVRDDDQGASVVTGLEGGEVQDLAGNPADLSGVAGLAFALEHEVDGIAPGSAVSIVSEAGDDDTYVEGDRIEFEVRFDDDVRVSGRPYLRVLIGSLKRRAPLVRTRPQRLYFAYTVQPGDADTNGISIGSGALQEGTITDAAGNPVTRSFTALPDDENHLVDTIEPSVDGVEIISDPGPGGTYAAGDAIIVEVTFDEPVWVTPPLELAIAVGAASRMAIYLDGSGTATLRFRYEVQAEDRDDDGISIGPDALRGGLIEDAAGNDWPEERRRIPAVPRQPGHKVSARGVPTVTSVRVLAPTGGDGFRAGDRIDAHVIFDRVVHVTGAPVLTLSVGANNRAAAFAGGSGTDTLRFHYTVVTADRDDDGISIPANALSEGRITDDTGNVVERRFRGVPPDARWTVDGSVAGAFNASLVITSVPEAGTTYGLGEDIDVEVRFNTLVHATGDPVLVLEIGGGTAVASLISGSGTDTLTFRYRVQEGDFDDDGISIGPNALQEGRIEDGAGSMVQRTFAALPADGDHKVDGVSPAVIRVTVVSTPDADDTYGVDEAISVEVYFGEEVHVTEDGGALSLVLSVGENLRSATLSGGSGTDTLTFRYVIQENDSDDDGISIGASALQGGRIEDGAGNIVERTFAALPADGDHKVDGVSPAVIRVTVVSTPDADDTYGVDEAISVEVYFGEEVHVTEDGGALSLVLSVGENLRSATLSGGSGTDTLTFRYVIQENDSDDDGISIGASALQGGRIEDGAGNIVERTFAALPADGDHKVDGVSPAVIRVTVVSTPDADDTYGVDEAISVEVYFGEEVHVTEDGGALSLVLSVGENLRSATLSGGSGTDTLTFRYVIQENDSDDDGISIGASALQGGRIEDGAGNIVERTFAALAADGDHKVDGVSPAVVRVTVVSTPDADDTYGVDEAISVEVYFGEEVHVTEDGGALSLVLSVGENLRSATLSGGSGTDTLTFRYVIQENDSDGDGISIGPNALQGGVIEDAAGNTVNRAFAGLEADGDHKVDGVRPVLTRVAIMSAPGESGFYGLDDEITIEVAFGEVVHVDAAEDVTLAISVGEHSRAATFVRGSGTDTLTFRYVVTEDDYDDDGVSIGPSALRGGTIEDAAGNAVERAFPGLEADSGQTVDGRVNRVVPAILRVAITSDAGSNNSYTTDDVIGVEVEFNVAVYVTGATPVLELSIGPALREATFVEGSGSRTLRFEYTVEAGDTDADGISIAANSLSGGITDANGNPVDISFEAIPASASHKVSAELLLFPLSLTLVVGQSHSLDLLRELERLGVRYVGGFEWSSDDEAVATAMLAGSMLTITSVSEGVARITVAATDAAIFLHFGVTVETSAAETAVLEGAMAAVGRGLLASAESTIGARLEMAESNPPDIWGGLGMAPASASAAAGPHWFGLDAADRWGSPVGHGHPGVDDPYLQRSIGYAPAQWLRGRWFDMPFGGLGNSVDSWAVWGAGDWHAFEGSPEDGIYDGSLASAYLGVDARGQGWVAGATVSRSLAEASYEFAGAAGGKGRLETELDAIHPYVQWAFGDRGKMWAILGFGTGEATAEREGDAVAAEPSSLSMLMGLGGLRYSFGRVVGVDLAVRGDAGFAQLETEEGPRAIEGLAVNVHRLRLGAEASLPMAFAGIPVSPFLDVAGRFDGGAGLTGGGVELAGGFRYRGPAVGLEVKGRTLAMHSAESYTEEGVKATLVVGPDGRRGFRLMLAPRWGGGAEAMDIFRYRGQPFAGALRRENRGWGLGTRISYGFDMLRRPGTVMPFAEMDLSGDASRRARLGVSYEIASAVLGLPHRLEISGEGTESELHGTILRFLLTGQAHF